MDHKRVDNKLHDKIGDDTKGCELATKNEQKSKSNPDLNVRISSKRDCVSAKQNSDGIKYDDNNDEADKSEDGDDNKKDENDEDDFQDHFSLSDLSEADEDMCEDIRILKENFQETDNDFDEQTNTLLSHLRSALGFPEFSKDSHSVEVDKRSSILSGGNLIKYLKDWFPHLPLAYLDGISKSHAVNKNDDIAMADLYCRIFDNDETIVNKDKVNEESTSFPFIRFRLFPPKRAVSTIFDLEIDNLYRLASSEYEERYKSCTQDSAPSLAYIDYIYNPKLVTSFEKTKSLFHRQKVDTSEKRLFHGTHQDCIKPIISGNFDVDAAPVQRQKVMAYGKGIYFSDYPSFSYQYGKSLLMCRVLTGTVTVNHHDLQQSHIHSFQQQSSLVRYKRWKSDKGVNKSFSQIYVIKDSNQILPCYILHTSTESDEGNKYGSLMFILTQLLMV